MLSMIEIQQRIVKNPNETNVLIRVMILMCYHFVT